MEKSLIGNSLFEAFNAKNLDLWANRLAPGFSADYPNAPGLSAQAARGALDELRGTLDLGYPINPTPRECAYARNDRHCRSKMNCTNW